MFVFDAHLDLSMNAMEWNRNLTWSVAEIRKSEKGMNVSLQQMVENIDHICPLAGNILQV